MTAEDEGWKSPDELERIRQELVAAGEPVEGESGIAAVNETRRLLEEARKQRQES